MKDKIIKSSSKPEKMVNMNQDGIVVREKTIKGGKLHGPVKLYWDNGNPRLKGKFDNNSRSGNWTHYDPEGKVILEESF